MPAGPRFPGPKLVTARLRETFVGASRWPIGKAALTALVDLGMSDTTIAQYFRVRADQVSELKCRYGFDPPSSGGSGSGQEG